MTVSAHNLWCEPICYAVVSRAVAAGRANAPRSFAKADQLADAGRESDDRGRDDPLSLLLVSVGDRQAFAELFAHFAPRLTSYFMRGGADSGAVEEIVQETMLTVWRRADSFDPGRSSAATWIYTIARNKRIDALRRERRYDPVPEPATAGLSLLGLGALTTAIRRRRK